MFEKTIACVKSGIDVGYPCAAVAIGRGYTVYRREFMGRRQIEPTVLPITEGTLFDLASLSKLVSTTMVALRLLEEGQFCLRDPIGFYLDNTGNFGGVQMRHLMTHTGGISPHLPLYTLCEASADGTENSTDCTKKDPVQVILDSKPVCGVGEEVYYSCMGYILLQRILENITGEKLDVLAKRLVFDPLGMHDTGYNPAQDKDFAATEMSPHWKTWTTGHVHDENAHWLGGVSGNAGVFSTLDDMITFAGMLSCHGLTKDGGTYLTKRVFNKAIHNYTPTLDESRGLGFQLMGNQWSPMGDLMSAGSYGHTGFTGTSLYVDSCTGLWGIFLQNSVHYGRSNRDASYPIRRKFYNLMTVEFDRHVANGEISLPDLE